MEGVADRWKKRNRAMCARVIASSGELPTGRRVHPTDGAVTPSKRATSGKSTLTA